MLPAVELVCGYQGKVDVAQSKMARIKFNTNFPSFICKLKDHLTQNSRPRFYPISHLLHSNEKY